MTGAAGDPPTGAVSPLSAPGRVSGWAELGPRVLSGLVLMAAALGVAFLGGTAFASFWLLASLAILWEWQRLIGNAGRYGQFGFGALALVGATWFAARGLPAYSLAVVAIVGIGLAASTRPGARLMSALGVFYAGALVIALCVLRNASPHGRGAILWLFAVVWGTDSMAYFGGRLLGGPKLWPRLSPSKTWSGFAIGVGCGSVFGWAVAPQPGCSFCMLVLGLLAGAVAQAGDLFESALKRRAGVKDTGGLIPGHGGVMDRLDGLLTASIFVACLGVWRLGVGSAGAGLFNW